jgi:hypothetical protein
MQEYKKKLFEDCEPLWWDEQVKLCSGSIFYSYLYIKYLELCNKNNLIKNLSYVIYNKNKILALVIIFIEMIKNQPQMSIGEFSIQSPLLNNNLNESELKNIKESIKININSLCKEHKCKLARFQVSSFNILINESIYKNLYYKWGFSKNINKSDWYDFQCKHSFVIDLKQKKETLYSNIRKSYKSLINKTKKSNVELKIINSTNLNLNLFKGYIHTHNKVKKNKRNIENLEFNFNLIKDNKQTVFLCILNNIIIGSFVALHFNKMAYYNSGYINYQEKLLHPTHFLLWQAIEYFHSNKYKFLHVGEKIDESIANLPSKHINLSFFKSGWGGQCITWEHAEKIYF